MFAVGLTGCRMVIDDVYLCADGVCDVCCLVCLLCMFLVWCMGFGSVAILVVFHHFFRQERATFGRPEASSSNFRATYDL